MPDESPFRAVHAAGIFLRQSILTALVLFSGALIAHDSGRNEPPFSQTVYNRLQFSEVEMIGRNHNVGTYRGGPLTLKAWVNVEDDVYLGIDTGGRLLQVLQLSDRTVAFLLSGDLAIDDFFFQAPARLVAIDKTGQVYNFDWRIWSTSGFPSVLRSTAKISTASTCLSWLSCMVSASLWGLPADSFPVLVEMGALTATVFTVQGMILANKFQMDNETTSGLQPVGEPISNFKSSEYVFDRRGQFVDVELKRRGEVSVRLSDVLKQSRYIDQSFAKTCEHKLLARGVPFEN